jgi:DNA-binding NtrC family response regulator
MKEVAMSSNLGLQDQSTGAVSKALDSGTDGGQVTSCSHPTLRALRAQAEIDAISHALQETGWNRKRAAQILNISYRGLLYKIQQHKITPEFTEQTGEPSEGGQ